MGNDALASAKRAKNDEYYTQWVDIEREMNAYLERDPLVFHDKTVLLPCDDPEWSNFTRYFAQNFQTFGLRKLVSTGYAPNRKPALLYTQPTLFEVEHPHYDPVLSAQRGKVFTLYRDVSGDARIDLDDLEWDYLEGDGDFRSPELERLRDEADIIITNPPFSLFRKFLEWVNPREKQTVLIGNMNAITYKEVFPLIQDDRLWLGATANTTDMVFEVPDGVPIRDEDREKARRLGYSGNFTRLGNSCWFTNLDHGRRHEPIPLMTEAENIKFSRHKEIRSVGYRKYDNYDALEVPFTEAIPGDYEGVVGVPISFLHKYCPEQFAIVGTTESNDARNPYRTRVYSTAECREAYVRRFGKPGVYDLNASGVVDGEKVYKRLLIRKR